MRTRGKETRTTDAEEAEKRRNACEFLKIFPEMGLTLPIFCGIITIGINNSASPGSY